MRLSDFDFTLPEELIALRPVVPRDQARLLHVADTKLHDHIFADLTELITAQDLLIVNDTRVIPARLSGERRRGDVSAQIDLTLIDRLPDGAWRALAKPAKRLQAGDEIFSGDVTIRVTDRDGAVVTLSFDEQQHSALETLQRIGDMPIPPYIAKKRPPDAQDRLDYQTMFAQKDGAVAAPTAGLHFTRDLVDRLAGQGVQFASVTLHVGAGTFLPLDDDRLQGDRLHSEWGQVTDETVSLIEHTQKRGGRVIPVGTTSLRILESAARSGTLRAFSGDTDIFIKPGYDFRVADGLITNFHLPQSSLFMLVCAFAGTQNMKAAYAHAIASGYRFYSYGDGCFLERRHAIHA